MPKCSDPLVINMAIYVWQQLQHWCNVGSNILLHLIPIGPSYCREERMPSLLWCMFVVSTLFVFNLQVNCPAVNYRFLPQVLIVVQHSARLCLCQTRTPSLFDVHRLIPGLCTPIELCTCCALGYCVRDELMLYNLMNASYRVTFA